MKSTRLVKLFVPRMIDVAWYHSVDKIATISLVNR